MKLGSILTLIFISCTAFGQNYRNICSEGITFFRNSHGEIGAFRRDSAIAPGTGDTTFLSYRTIIDTSGICMDTTQGSVLGRTITATSSGMFHFFNANNDTIRISSQATVGQTWRFCTLDGGNYIAAQVTSITPGQILGEPDNIKNILLQAKNSSGTNIAHPYNNKIIQLSQHYGLIKIPHVYHIPYDTSTWTLAGKSSPLLGIQNLTWQDVYDYQPGDEFHYQNNFSSRIEIVLQRIDYGTDSVDYVIEHCEKGYDPNIPQYYTIHDTITRRYRFNLNPDIPGRMPDEFVNENNSASSFSFFDNDFGNRRTKKTVSPAFAFDTVADCWTELSFFHIRMTNQYTEGLGRTRFIWEQTEPITYFVENLVYYHKQTGTWGTPVATDCNMLVSVNEQTQTSSLIIFPNPLTANAEIENRSGIPCNYELINPSGRTVRKGILSPGKTTFQRNNLPSGMYILLISTTKHPVSEKLKMIIL